METVEEVVKKILEDIINKVDSKSNQKQINDIENMETENITFLQLHEEEPEGQKTLTKEQATYLDILYDE
jgi:hypothetical protein